MLSGGGGIRVISLVNGPLVVWNGVAGAVSYEIAYGTKTQQYVNFINVGNVTSYGLGGLTQGQIYFCTVTAINANGTRSVVSDEWNFRVPITGQQKYVSTTGGGTGTIGNPWSLATALTSASAGDTVYLRAGTYSGNFAVGVSGSAGNVITFRPYPGEAVQLTCATGNTLTLTAKSYVRIEGFEVTTSATGAAGIFITGECHHLEIHDNECHGFPGNGSSGIFVQGPTVTPAMSFVTNNYCHHNGGGGITFLVYTSGYWRIEGNECAFCDTGGNFDGLQIGSGSGAGNHMMVRRNYLHDNNQPNNAGGDQLDLGGHALAHHYLVEENLVVLGTGHGAFKIHSGGPTGAPGGVWTDGTSGHTISRFNVLVGVEQTVYEFPTTGVHYNNTWFDSTRFIQFFWQTAGTAHLGDSTYATWNTTNSTTDTDTGRWCAKNNLFVQSTNQSDYIVMSNDNTGAGQTLSVSYADVRLQNNRYKLVALQREQWGTYFTTAIDTNFVAGYQASNSPNLPDTGSTKYSSGTAISSILNNQPIGDYQPASGAAHIGTAGALTTAIGSGSNSTSLTVDRASYFYDGYPNGGELVGYPDTIVIGTQPPVQISSIGESTNPSVFNVITLSQPRTWSNGDAVKLYNKGNDMGAIDSVSGAQRPMKPTGMYVLVPQS